MLMKKGMLCLWSVAAFVAIMGCSGITFAGSPEPSTPPAPTMKTLDEIQPKWSQILAVDDGDVNGCGSSRFDCVLNGNAVLDKETGFVWEKSPSTTTSVWTGAISDCYTREVENRKGWRLPTVDELTSLVDNSQSSPALPVGHPFLNVKSSWYWSANTSVPSTTFAWFVDFRVGFVSFNVKTNDSLVWCVRGGP